MRSGDPRMQPGKSLNRILASALGLAWLCSARLAWATGDVPGDSLSVADCVALARGGAPLLAAALLERSAASSDSAATALNSRPALSLISGATLAPNGYYDPTITNLGDYQLKLALTWTAADGGRRARERQRSAIGSWAARERAALETRETGLQAATLAFRLLRLQQQVPLGQQGLEWLDRLGSLVRSGVAAGMRGSSDSIRVALERDAVVAATEVAELESRTTSIELAGLLRRGSDTLPGVREPRVGMERAPTVQDSLALLASIDRLPEVAMARAGEALGQLDMQDARHRDAAGVELVLDAGWAGADLTAAVPENLRAVDPGAGFGDRLRRDMGASAAVRIGVPLLDRARAPSLRAREYALAAARVRTAAESQGQRERARVLLAGWSTAWRQLAAAEQTQGRAERNLLKVRSLYTAGATTLLDLLDARRAYADTRDRVLAMREAVRVAQWLVEDRR